MMDSQEKKNALDTQQENENVSNNAAESKNEKTVFTTKQEVIDRLNELLKDAENTNKSELDALRISSILNNELLKL